MYRIAGCVIFLLSFSTTADAAPFDLIVPSEVQVRTPPAVSGVGSPWGWIVATDTELTLSDLNAAVFFTTVDNPLVGFDLHFGPGAWTPMIPGDVAGLDETPFTDALRLLLEPGEALIPASSNFWRWEFTFPPQLTGEASLHTSLTIGGKIATFDTHVEFGPDFGTDVDPLVIVSAQRLAAVPEPSTGALVPLAFVALLWRRSS